MRILRHPLCEQCRGPFPTYSTTQSFCCPRCYHRWLGVQRRGIDMRVQTEAKVAKDRTRSRATLAAEFGPLSEREVALVRHAIRYARRL